jgi:hypothetical protein
MPLHRLGRDKYTRLGRDYPAERGSGLLEDSVCGDEELVRAKEILARYGLDVQFGG